MSQHQGTRLAALAAAALLGGGGVRLAAQQPLPDGVYKVDRLGTQRVQVAPVHPGEQLLIYDYRYFEPAAGRSAQLIVVATEPDVPLELAERPQQIADAAGQPAVRLLLNAAAAALLEEFTRGLAGGRFAIVVDGEVVTVNKARGVISGGELVISGCREIGCDLLRQQLVDNVRPE
jgi:hypothetical protein